MDRRIPRLGRDGPQEARVCRCGWQCHQRGSVCHCPLCVVQLGVLSVYIAIVWCVVESRCGQLGLGLTWGGACCTGPRNLWSLVDEVLNVAPVCGVLIQLGCV